LGCNKNETINGNRDGQAHAEEPAEAALTIDQAHALLHADMNALCHDRNATLTERKIDMSSRQGRP